MESYYPFFYNLPDNQKKNWSYINKMRDLKKNY